MTVDLTTVPWNRLAALAPPGTTEPNLQSAADRWALTTDVYNAAADLWEEKALFINIDPDTVPEQDSGVTSLVQSVSQDGISVTYSSGLNVDSQTTRIAQRSQLMATVRRLRAMGKPRSPLMHDPDYDPWVPRLPGQETEIIIPIITEP